MLVLVSGKRMPGELGAHTVWEAMPTWKIKEEAELSREDLGNGSDKVSANTVGRSRGRVSPLEES